MYTTRQAVRSKYPKLAYGVNAAQLSGMKKTLYSDEHKKLRKLLRQVRLGAGLRQEDLAKLVGKPQSFISKCESGERCLDLLELRQVCRAIGMSLSDFVIRLEESLK